jgi:cytochrome oxidase Cu insertion factor (SCO1/SenC/PrrC family)
MEELKSAEEAFLASSTIVTDASGKIEVGHSATTYVVDESGIVLVEWPFGVDKDTMINDLRILLDTV